MADKEPREPAVFCDICQLIQSCAYGIVDITGLNPNVLLELGMMFAFGKPVFILVNKKDEESLREKLPSDIVWRRTIPYEEYIDIEEALSEALKSRPIVEPRPSLAEEMTKVVAQIDPAFAKELNSKLQEFRTEQKEELAKMAKLLEEAREGTTQRARTQAMLASTTKKIDAMYKKTEPLGRLMGPPEDSVARARARSFSFLSNAYHNEAKRQYNAALRDYDFALKANPQAHYIWNHKAQLLIKLKRSKDAIASYRKFLEYEKNDVSALENLAEALLLDGKFHSGLRTARKSLRFSKNVGDKAISLYLCLVAQYLEKEEKQASNTTRELLTLLKGRRGSRLSFHWTFSPLMPLIKEKMREVNAQKCLRVISLLRGRISLKEFRAGN